MNWNVGDWYEVDEEKLGVDSRDGGKHTERQQLDETLEILL